MSSLLDFLRLCVLCAILLLLHTAQAANTAGNSPNHVTHPISQLVFSCFSSASTGLLMSRMSHVYEFLRGDPAAGDSDLVTIDAIQLENTLTASSSTILFNKMQQGEIDFAFSTFVPTEEQRIATPDLIHFPAAGIAFGAVYSIPTLQSPLILDLESIARILSGNITRWNDNYLAKLNPMARLPSHSIQVVLLDEVASYVSAATIALRAVDEQFRNMIAESSLPQWPLHRYATYTVVHGIDGPSSFVSSNPYSFALSLLSYASAFNTPIASMRNSAGSVTPPSFAAIQNAFSDLATLSSFDSVSNSIVTDVSDSISDAPGINSWPLMLTGTFSFTYHFSRSTCRQKSELAKFLLFVLNSDVIQNVIAAEMYSTFSTKALDEGIGLRDFLTTKMRCEELPLNVHSTASSVATVLGYSALSSAHTDAWKLLVTIYANSHSTADFHMVAMDEQFQLQQMLNRNEVDMGWILPITFRHLYPGVLEQYTADGRFSFFPSEIRGVVPTYSLDANIKAYMMTHQALPLKVDMEILAKVFTGVIISWLAPEIVRYNPLLSDAFAAFPTVKATIHVVVFGTGDPSLNAYSALSNHIIVALNHTQVFQSSGITWTLPADWTVAAARIQAAGGLIEFAPTENSMETQIEFHSNSIGYRLVTSNITSLTDFQIIKQSPATGELIILEPTLASFKACADAVNLEGVESLGAVDVEAVLDYKGSVATQCWPIPILSTVVLPTDATTSSTTLLIAESDSNLEQGVAKDIASVCFHRKHVVQFLEWLSFDPLVNAPLEMLGRQAFMFSSEFQEAFATNLYDLKCGGQYILHQPSESWELTSEIYDFVLILAALGIISCCIVGALLYRHRHRTLIRSSNYVMQMSAFFGIVLVLVTAILFVLPVTDRMCGAISWIVTVGLSLLITPQTLKIFKVYQTAAKSDARRNFGKSRRNKYTSIKVISSLHMYLILAAVVAMDAAVLIATQIIQPDNTGLLSTSFTSVSFDSELVVYGTCALTSSTLPYGLFLLLSKILLFCAGSWWAFKVRHLSSAFGESTKISWSLWNGTICIAIILPLLALTKTTHGNMYTFLLSLLLLWIGIGSVLLLFGSKALLLVGEAWVRMRKENRTTSRTSSAQSSSHMSSSGYDSAASGSNRSTFYSSISAMSLTFPRLDHLVLGISQLEQYIDALEQHLYEAQCFRVQINPPSPVQQASEEDTSLKYQFPNSQSEAMSSVQLQGHGTTASVSAANASQDKTRSPPRSNMAWSKSSPNMHVRRSPHAASGEIITNSSRADASRKEMDRVPASATFRQSKFAKRLTFSRDMHSSGGSSSGSHHIRQQQSPIGILRRTESSPLQVPLSSASASASASDNKQCPTPLPRGLQPYEPVGDSNVASSPVANQVALRTPPRPAAVMLVFDNPLPLSSPSVITSPHMSRSNSPENM